MRIVLTKLGDNQHRFEVIRDDGTRASQAFATREFLVHDLTHDAVESEARIGRGFFGLLARGESLASLLHQGKTLGTTAATEIADVERIVGPLSSVMKGRVDPERALEAIDALLVANGRARPGWLDAAFVQRVQASMRALLGRWKATPYRGALELPWPG